jgi:hypothetical protein
MYLLLGVCLKKKRKNKSFPTLAFEKLKKNDTKD